MPHFLLRLKINTDINTVWADLEAIRVTPLYSETDESGTSLILEANDQTLFQEIAGIQEVLPFELPAIDWEEQWQIHCPAIHEGIATISLKEGVVALLAPGAGFGDCSHPTTRLLLSLLDLWVDGKAVVDIGCGSGILAIASTLLGAKFVAGIEIDQQAIEHAKSNIALNHLTSSSVWVGEAHELPSLPNVSKVFLMNMIFSEQKQAWDSLKELHHIPAMILTSGILKEQKEAYLNWTESLGWVFKEEWEEEDWMAFRFSQIIQKRQ